MPLNTNTANQSLRRPLVKRGRTGAVVSVVDYGPRGPWFETWPFVVALSKSHLPPAKYWLNTGSLGRATDEAGDYVVPNVLSRRDLVSRPDKMDETVLFTAGPAKDNHQASNNYLKLRIEAVIKSKVIESEA